MKGDVLTLDTRESRVRRMRKNVLTTANLVTGSVRGGRRLKAAMVTLTYREGVEWEPRHITAMMKSMRAWATRRGVSIPYVWVAELTKRGRIHYHLLVWLPSGLCLPKPDKQGWWQHGMTRIEWAKCAPGYLAKYASKGQDAGTFPKGLRLCSRGGLECSVRTTLKWWLLPSWLRNVSAPDHDFTRQAGGGFVSRATSELVRSPFRLIAVAASHVRVVQSGELPLPSPVPLSSDLRALLERLARGMSAPVSGSFGLIYPTSGHLSP